MVKFEHRLPGNLTPSMPLTRVLASVGASELHSAVAAQPTTGEFGGTDSRKRKLARDAVGGITLGGSPRIAELEQQLETMRTALQEVETMDCSF